MALALGSVIVFWLTESSLPEPLREHLKEQQNADPTPMEWALLAIGVPLVVAGIASFVGMLRFRHWSRPLAVGTSVTSVLLLPAFGPTVEPGVVTGLNYVSSMLFGAVLALAYYSPAAEWFERK
jgi:hypothetical protein